MPTLSKQKIIIAVDIEEDKNFLTRLAKYLGIEHSNEINKFITSVFFIALTEEENCSEEIWDYLIDSMGSRLDVLDLTKVNILIDLAVGSILQTIENSTGLTKDVSPLVIDRNLGLFLFKGM
jgi:hypothetical protein